MIAALVLAIAAGWSYAQDSGTSGPATTLEAHGLRIVFFHSLTCNECRKVKRMLDRILKPWGGRARVEWKSTGDIQVFRELLLYDEHYGVRTKSPPVMFVGRRHLEGEKRIYRDLARVVREELAAGAVTYRPPAGPATKGGGDVPEEIVGRFRGFRIGALAAAGLLDGVNPCAFTTIVFLLSMLAYLGKTRRQLAVVGVGFTAAVFVTYFLLGLGLLGAIKTFSVSRGISTGLAIAVGVLAFVLAAWSLVDFVRYRRTRDTKKVTLGLPKSVKARIHKVIRAGLRTRNLLIGSITVGFLVSVLESLCTGQVYLPTIMFDPTSRHASDRGNASALGTLLSPFQGSTRKAHISGGLRPRPNPFRPLGSEREVFSW
jgi:cytochrome c biogenesis protein CcdA